MTPELLGVMFSCVKKQPSHRLVSMRQRKSCDTRSPGGDVLVHQEAAFTWTGQHATDTAAPGDVIMCQKAAFT